LNILNEELREVQQKYTKIYYSKPKMLLKIVESNSYRPKTPTLRDGGV